MSPRTGRPREMERRVKLQVYVDALELRAIQEAARAERTSAAKWARRLLVAAARGSRKETTMQTTSRKRGRRSRHGR